MHTRSGFKTNANYNFAYKQAIPPELRSKREKGAAIVTDVDDGTGKVEDLPEPSKAGVLDVAKDAAGNKDLTGLDPQAKEPPYSRTGWAPKFGWGGGAGEAESLLDHASWLEGHLPDSLYGGRFLNRTCLPNEGFPRNDY